MGCATVHNIVATVPGQAGTQRSVLLVAHYDSVPAGPGASDDGSGVAEQVEAARALLNGPPLHRPVTLLVTDAEEAGLLGAHAYAERHDLPRGVFAVVNLEARGTTGPSLMFETGPGNRAVIDLFAGAAPRPVTTSVFTAIYEQMPHDTDFEVFTGQGLPGVNLAVIGDLPRYHTPLDDLASVDLASVQHQGDTALAVTRALAQHPEGEIRRDEDAVFFDVLGLAVLRWPVGWTVPLAGLVLLLGGITTALAVRRGQVSGGGVVRAGVGVLLLGVSGTVLAVGAHLLLRVVGAAPGPWVAHPAPALVAVAVAAALPVLPVAAWARAAGWAATWSAGWWLMTLTGLAVAVPLPEASYLFLIPALVAWLTALAVLTTRAGTSATGAAAVLLLPLAALVLLWAPLTVLVWQALGFTGLLVGLGPAWLPAWLALLVLLLPFASGWRLAGRWPVAAGVGALAAVVAVAVLVAGLVPTFTAQTPQHATLLARRDQDRQSSWRAETLGPLPAPWHHLADWTNVVTSPNGLQVWQAPAPAVQEPDPEFEPAGGGITGNSGEVRRVTGRLLPAGGDELFFRLPADRVANVRLNDLPVPPAEHDPRYIECRIFAPPPAGLRLELEITGGGPVPLQMVSLHHQLPPAGQRFRQARPPSAVPVDLGDATRLDTVTHL